MEYRVVEAETGGELAEMVSEALSQGWNLVGGVSVAGMFRAWENDRKGYQETEAEWRYVQAMVRSTDKGGQ